MTEPFDMKRFQDLRSQQIFCEHTEAVARREMMELVKLDEPAAIRIVMDILHIVQDTPDNDD